MGELIMNIIVMKKRSQGEDAIAVVHLGRLGRLDCA